MLDAPSPACLTLYGAERRYRALLAQGVAAPEALAELVAYLVVLRPGLPRCRAVELAEAIAAGTAAGAALPRQHPPGASRRPDPASAEGCAAPAPR